MTFAPRSFAFITQRKPTGCASAMDEPWIQTQSEFWMSCWKLLIHSITVAAISSGPRKTLADAGEEHAMRPSRADSALRVLIASAGIICLSGTAAYAFARLQFKFRTATLSSLLILQMFPMVLSLIAFYVIIDFVGQYAKWLGLNTHAGLVLVYLGGISGYIWMIKGYFEMIPASMEESARIDGANQFQTFIWILLPMSVPIFAVVFILSFISYMSEYPVASVVLQSNDNWTLAVGANSFLFEQKKFWGRFSALAVLSGVPITLVFLLCQRYVIGGLTAGGVKE